MDAHDDAGLDAALDASTDASEAARDAAPDACTCPPLPDNCRYEGDPCMCFYVCDTPCDGVYCTSAEYCDYRATNTCEGRARCEPRPVTCTGELDPVCGCDKVSHENRCLALQRGADIAYDGMCDCRRVPCDPGEICVNIRSTWGDQWVCRVP